MEPLFRYMVLFFFAAMAQTTANPYSVTNKGIVTLGNNATYRV